MAMALMVPSQVVSEKDILPLITFLSSKHFSIYISINGRRIYCCFIDYKKAFDNVSRVSLWTEMLSLNINGQILNVIKNLYSNAKCYIKMNGKLSNVFRSEIVVRQGDNLSPLLFSIYLSNLESFLCSKNGGLAYISELTENDDALYEYIKMYIILYADDTVTNRASNVIRCYAVVL